MRLDIDSTETPAIWGVNDAAPALEIYADEQFDTSDGKPVFPGSVELGDFRYRVIGEVENEIAVFPAIVGIYSTEDSLTNQRATYSAYLRVKGREPIPWLERFPIPPLLNGFTSTSWTRLRQHAAATRARPNNDTYTKQETAAAIEASLLQYQASRMPSDVALMVDGEAIVSTAGVLVTSRIIPFSMDPGVTGRLRCEQADIAEGEGFIIRSTNVGDNGAVGWLILN